MADERTRVIRQIPDIVDEFFVAQLALRGHQWAPSRDEVDGPANGQPNGGIVNSYALDESTRKRIRDAMNSLAAELMALQGDRMVEMVSAFDHFRFPSMLFASLRAIRLTDEKYVSSSSQAENMDADRLTTAAQRARAAFDSIASEMFSEGVTWSHILTILAFAVECAYRMGVARGETDFVDECRLWVVRFLTTWQQPDIVGWIIEHGGLVRTLSHHKV